MNPSASAISIFPDFAVHPRRLGPDGATVSPLGVLLSRPHTTTAVQELPVCRSRTTSADRHRQRRGPERTFSIRFVCILS